MNMGSDPVPSTREDLIERLRRPADDMAAMQAMVPQNATRDRNRPLVPPQNGVPYRHSAVLLLFYPVENDWLFPLTLRTADLRQHSGEVSFPGGRYDDADETLEQTALREAWEELGIVPADVEVVGTLTPVWIPVSNFLVQPVVGLTSTRPRWAPATNEVAVLVEGSLRVLMKPESLRMTRRLIRGMSLDVPYFAIQGHEVWGATAIILAQLLNRLR